MTTKRIWAAAAVLAMVCVFVLTYGTKADQPAKNLSAALGIYDSQAYRDWGASVAIGNSATGSQTITICPGLVALRDGRNFQPFAAANGVFSPFTIDPQSSLAETLTPTASSLVSPPTGYNGNPQIPCASVTASFSNTHGASLSQSQVISGDQGVQEAINDASLAGGGKVRFVIDPGLVTLNTGGANTDVAGTTIPTRSVIEVASAKVTTTITSCTGGWSLGGVTDGGTFFTAANTTLTAGTTTDSSTLSVPKATTSAELLRITCTTSNAGAGVIHPHLEGYKVVPPAS